MKKNYLAIFFHGPPVIQYAIIIYYPTFFPAASVTEPLIKGDEMREYLSKHVNPTLIKGLTELCKQKPKDPVVRYLTVL